MRCNIWAMYINITNQYNDIIYVKLIYYFDLVYNYIRSYQWAELCFSISSQYGAFQRHGGTPKSSSRGWPWLSIGQQPWWLGDFGDPPKVRCDERRSTTSITNPWKAQRWRNSRRECPGCDFQPEMNGTNDGQIDGKWGKLMNTWL